VVLKANKANTALVTVDKMKAHHYISVSTQPLVSHDTVML